MQFLIYTGIAAFGLFCIINPKYLLERTKAKKGKEYTQKDVRFFRIFGGVLVGLYLLGYVIQLVINLRAM
jgi:hypothetical protein